MTNRELVDALMEVEEELTEWEMEFVGDLDGLNNDELEDLSKGQQTKLNQIYDERVG